jgi:hypothetical protein
MTVRGSVAERQNDRSPKRVLLGLGLCLCLFVVAMASVTAQADDSPSGPPARPTVAEMEESLNASNSAVHEPEWTDPQAAEELPHEDLDREEAVELISEVFSPELQAPAGIFDELEVERFVSDNAAIIGAGDQPEMTGTVIGASASQRYEGPTLLESTVPLRVEGDSGPAEAVDLALEHAEGELQPANPLVEVGIPQNLGEGIDISNSGVTIELQGAPIARTPSTVEDSVALYPEVAPDSSLAVAPTPSGVETLSLLQSPEAPTSETFHLDLPEGSSLEATADGGAEVVQGGRPLIGIPAPSALDANGDEVPVSLEVSGNSLVLKASPAEDAAYPILVDPVYEDYNWLNNITGITGWNKWSSTPNYYADDHATCTTYASPYACQSSLASNQKGMYLGLLPGSVPAGSGVGWEYHVPRWSEDWTKTKTAPTSFISSMTFEAFAMWPRTDTSSDPIMWTGIWNTQTPGWVSGYAKGGDTAPWNYPGNYQTYNAPPDPQGHPNTEGKVGAFDVGNGSGHNLTAFRDAFLGRAIINLGDTESPKLSPILATNWLNASSGSFPIAYTVTDTGLGVARVEATDPSGNVYKTPTGTTCPGTAPNPCPRTKTPSSEPGNKLEYDISKLPQGISQIAVTAQDPLGNKSAATTAEVLVDRTPPALTASGTVTEQAKAPNASEYKLKYSATDGDSAAPVALSQFSGAGTGEGKLERPLGTAVDKEGNVWVVDRTNRRVEEFSESGQFLRQFGKAGPGNGEFMDPCGIAISSTGNIVVSDITNNNVQIFSPTGQFIRAFTYSGFVDPYAIAPASGGALWVSDITSHHVWQFSETGALLKTLTQPMNSPSGLATDAAGNLWVSDTAENRILKFRPGGDLLMQFGSTGSGNGQFVTPTSIAAAPSGNIMVSDAGNNRLQEFQPNGVYLRKFGSAGTGLGQVTEERSLAFGPGNVLYLADAGNHRIGRWSHADRDNESGVASTEVKVDGNLVEPKYAPGCPVENCSIPPREWTFKSNQYSSGQHTVKVIATDAAGNPAPKEFTLTADSTAPEIKATSAFFTAPEGWLEQKTYIYSSTALDASGSGVVSIALKIDGKVVKSTEQSCPSKACSANVGGAVNMANYKGGAHPAELIATDVAGNTAKKAWTINVDPKGAIQPSEAARTLEAVEATGGTTIVSPGEPSEEPEGEVVPVLHRQGEDIYTSGAPAETTMTVDPADGFTLQTPEEPIEVAPVSTAIGATEAELTSTSATVAGNVSSNVDAIARPIYDGDMAFQSIRDASSPETFSWEVELGSRLSMSQIDSENIGVYHPDGSEAMLISAVLAHDAVGKAVSTTITLEAPNIVTLTVKHRAVGVTYPVVSGASFEVGYEFVETYDPPPPAEAGEEGEEEETGELEISAPEIVSAAEAEVEDLIAWRHHIEHKSFRWIQCHHMDDIPDVHLIKKPGGVCGNPFTRARGEEDVAFNYGIRGDYYILPGKWVKHKGSSTDHIECDKMLDSEHIENWGLIHWNYFIFPASKCEWYGHTKDGGGSFAEYGKHITPYGEWTWGYTTNTQNPQHAGLALYLWASKDEHVGHHPTTCIDCS